MNHGFQDFLLTPDQKLWMQTVYDSGDFNIDRTRAVLQGRIADDFDPATIDARLYKRNHLTLIGIFHVDPQSPIFTHVQKIMELISLRIKQNDDFMDITSLELSNVLDISVEKIEHAVYFLSEMGTYFDGVYRHSADAGSLVLNFKTDIVRAKYQRFLNLGDVMEMYFQSKHMDNTPVPQGDEMDHAGKGDDAVICRDLSKTPTPQGFFTRIPQIVWDVLAVGVGIIFSIL